MYRAVTVVFLLGLPLASAQVPSSAPNVSATITVFGLAAACMLEIAEHTPSTLDVPCSEVAVTLSELGVPRGSTVTLHIFAAISREQISTLNKEIEDHGYVVGPSKVGFLIQPDNASR